jgi:hypothetical protein
MADQVTLTIEGTELAGTVSEELSDSLPDAQGIEQEITLTTSFVGYTAPNASVSRLLIIPTWTNDAANAITHAGASGDTGYSLGSLWEFAYVPVAANTEVYLKCASSTNAPTATLRWL